MGSGANFEQTSSLRVCVILLAFVILSVFFEKLLHALEHWFEHMHKEGLNEVLERLKEEVLLVGFLSLLLLASEDKLLTICMGAYTFNGGVACHASDDSASHRLLAAAGDTGCPEGQQPFVSAAALHQTHILIFLMAACHITFCALTMFMTEHTAGRWRRFEDGVVSRRTGEAILKRLQKQVPVVHEKPWRQNLHHFLGQFAGTVNRLTYMSLRHWFIAKHKLPFDYQFHDYIMRCIHSDFSQTMGVRWWMWVLLMINVLSDGFDVGNIVIPTSTVILSLVVGTKLHAIAQDLTRKCFDLHDHNDNKKLDKKELDIMHTVSDGRAATFAQAYINDKLFWFEKPWLMLVCIQCVMFQNALELAMAAFYAWQVGMHACFFDATGVFVFIRMALSGALLFHNAVVMLPCYSLVVQMGSRFNHKIVTDQVRKQLKAMAILTRQQSEERGLVAQIAVTAKRRAHAAVDAAKSVTQSIQQRVSGSTNAAALPGSVRGMGGKGSTVAPANPYARAQPSSFLAQLGASQRQLQEAQAELAEQARVLALEEETALKLLAAAQREEQLAIEPASPSKASGGAGARYNVNLAPLPAAPIATLPSMHGPTMMGAAVVPLGPVPGTAGAVAADGQDESKAWPAPAYPPGQCGASETDDAYAQSARLAGDIASAVGAEAGGVGAYYNAGQDGGPTWADAQALYGDEVDQATYEYGAYAAAQYDPSQYDASQYDASQYDASQYDASQYDASQYGSAYQSTSQAAATHNGNTPAPAPSSSDGAGVQASEQGATAAAASPPGAANSADSV